MGGERLAGGGGVEKVDGVGQEGKSRASKRGRSCRGGLATHPARSMHTPARGEEEGRKGGSKSSKRLNATRGEMARC